VKSDGSQLSLTRVRCTLPAAKCLEFTADESSLVVVTCEGLVHLINLDSVSPELLKAIEPPSAGYVAMLLS